MVLPEAKTLTDEIIKGLVEAALHYVTVRQAAWATSEKHITLTLISSKHARECLRSRLAAMVDKHHLPSWAGDPTALVVGMILGDVTHGAILYGYLIRIYAGTDPKDGSMTGMKSSALMDYVICFREYWEDMIP